MEKAKALRLRLKLMEVRKVLVFTTRLDTLFGCTYTCLAPEHPLVEKIVTKEQAKEVKAYKEEVARKSDLERTN